MEIALDEPRMFHVGRTAFEDIREEGSSDASQFGGHALIEMALQRRQPEKVIRHYRDIGTFRVRNRSAAFDPGSVERHEGLPRGKNRRRMTALAGLPHAVVRTEDDVSAFPDSSRLESGNQLGER